MKKCVSLFLSLVFVLSMYAGAGANEYTLLQTGGRAKVLEVIDGDSVTVKMEATGEIALVRFAGIDAVGFDESLKYLRNTLTGKTVELSFDPYGVRYVGERWNNMIVRYKNEDINARLVSMGLAKVTDESGGANYAGEEAAAKEASRGGWDKPVKPRNYYPPENTYGPVTYSGDGVNINTASHTSLRENLPDIPVNVINAIVAYRQHNPFNDIYEIKFIPGFTGDMFNKYRTVMTVSTNIQKATEKELLTLGYISVYDARRIITQREKRPFDSKEDLTNYNFIPAALYKLIEDFIDITDILKLPGNIRVPKEPASQPVSLNDAGAAELSEIGFTSAQADALVNGRGKYSYKTLGELSRLPGLWLSEMDIHRYADNVTVGAGNYININFAGAAELAGIGLDPKDINALNPYKRRMFSAADIPADISEFDGAVSLYTNINSAQYGELASLGIAPEVCEAVIKYRANQPFGSAEEFRILFETTKYTGSYNTFLDIRYFITVR